VNWVAQREGLGPEERRGSCGVRASPVWNFKISGRECVPSHQFVPISASGLRGEQPLVDRLM
jgi:hypothetical protein